MVAHRFLDQPANLRYRTIFFVAIGLVIRLALVLSKLNVKCDNRRFSCSTNGQLCLDSTKLLSMLMALYSTHLCLHMCFYVALVPLFTGASAAQ